MINWAGILANVISISLRSYYATKTTLIVLEVFGIRFTYEQSPRNMKLIITSKADRKDTTEVKSNDGTEIDSPTS